MGTSFEGTFLACALACSMCSGGLAINDQKHLDGKLDELGKKVENVCQEQKPEIEIKNILGGPEDEKYYFIAGEFVYLEIDGKPVEEYLGSNNKQVEED